MSEHIYSYNIAHFLEAIAESQYKIDKLIINRAFERMIEDISMLKMHHVCR